MSLAFTTAQKTLQSIKSMLPRLVTSGVVVAGEPTLYVEPANVLTVCDFLKNHTGTRCKALMDVTAIDVPTREKRFEVRLRPASATTAAAISLPSAACLHAHRCSLGSFSDHPCTNLYHTPCSRLTQVAYQLLSVEHNSRMRVKTLVGGHEGDSGVPSLAGIFSSANWLEREVWDMYGIYFEGHPDLRRILTDYGFQGHPLRKDFPLSGFVECRYDPSKKRVVTEPLELTQEFRQFEFLSPWKEK
jgi:NADH dehydrogenase (ubiquinone) Fe-S protein 3